MSLVKPFRALRPVPGRAAEIIAPPYDVLSTAEARLRAEGKPLSFLHVSKPEIDLPEATDPYSPQVYAKAAENLDKLVESGALMRDGKPCYYIYRLTHGSLRQTGIAGVASVADYATNRVRKHEFTTPVKEDDRTRQIEAVNAQTGPVMIAYRSEAGLDGLIEAATKRKPDVDATADDGVRHEMWVLSDDAMIAKISAAFDAMPAIYIADGHHRSAAAQRVAAARGKAKGAKDAPHDHFLAVIFPHTQMTILDYNRVVRDLNKLTPEAFLKAVEKSFKVEPLAAGAKPASPQQFAMYLGKTWYRLTVKDALVPKADPIGRLAVTLLHKHLIEPILGISDPRRDKRIDFVGGARGLEGLQARVDSGEMAVAFALFPTPMEDLMAVADAGGVMPPKSTWFEPKLADGMVSHVLD